MFNQWYNSDYQNSFGCGCNKQNYGCEKEYENSKNNCNCGCHKKCPEHKFDNCKIIKVCTNDYDCNSRYSY